MEYFPKFILMMCHHGDKANKYAVFEIYNLHSSWYRFLFLAAPLVEIEIMFNLFLLYVYLIITV